MIKTEESEKFFFVGKKIIYVDIYFKIQFSSLFHFLHMRNLLEINPIFEAII